MFALLAIVPLIYACAPATNATVTNETINMPLINISSLQLPLPSKMKCNPAEVVAIMHTNIPYGDTKKNDAKVRQLSAELLKLIKNEKFDTTKISVIKRKALNHDGKLSVEFTTIYAPGTCMNYAQFVETAVMAAETVKTAMIICGCEGMQFF